MGAEKKDSTLYLVTSLRLCGDLVSLQSLEFPEIIKQLQRGRST